MKTRTVGVVALGLLAVLVFAALAADAPPAAVTRPAGAQADAAPGLPAERFAPLARSGFAASYAIVECRPAR